jgi:hypothetical protein
MIGSLFLLADGEVTTKFELGRIQSNFDWWIYAGVPVAVLVVAWLARKLSWPVRLSLTALAVAALLVLYVLGRLGFLLLQSGSLAQFDLDWLLYSSVALPLLALFIWVYPRDTAELHWSLRLGLPLLRIAVLIGLLFVWLEPRWRSEREEHHDSRVLLMVDTSLSMGKTDTDTPGGRAGKSRLQQVAAALDETEFIARLRKKHQVTVVPFNTTVEQKQRVTLPKEGAAVPASAGSAEKLPLTGGTTSAEPPRGGTPAPAWGKQLVLGGNDTRLGDALEQVVGEGRTMPVSGVVLISDGGLNAGASPDAAEEIARELHIPVYTVGVGSEKKPASVSVVALNVPPRAFPGERFTVEGAVEGFGLKGRSVTVELLSREGTAADDPLRRGQGARIDSCEVTLAGDGEAVPVTFNLPPLDNGRHVLCLRVKPSGAAGSDRMFEEGEVTVDAKRMRVLLLAGGPMRDYQYLRTMLFRDKSIVVDVLLQSGQPGISQEATNLLTQFPTSRAQMAEYDCLVGFDPDWLALKPEQVDLLYDWVDQDHGGLIVVAGAVNTGRPDGWVQNAEMAKIRALYPVEFNAGLSTSTNVMYGGDEASRLEFTREGLQAPYLWLGDSAAASQITWAEFAGIYGFCPVRDKKAGATVLARFGDPRTSVEGQQPIYMAVHRFSASPVVYLGSAETWRLRRLNPAWFEMLWTKLIRYAAQEHLRRQSARGSLVVDHDRYPLGSTVEVRAELKNAELRPLLAAAGVTLQIIRDGKEQQTMTMPPDPSRPGRFVVDIPVLQQGDYTLKLPVPQGSEILSRTFHGVVPKLEDENPQRNVALLQEIAKKTKVDESDKDGYYADLWNALNDTSSQSLAERLKDVSSTDKIKLAPKPEDDEKLLKWMLLALCGVLSLEWLVRRLAKLA